MKNWGRWLIERLVHVCWWLLDIYHELKPCRFSFIVAILGAIVFLSVNQGTEVLRALAEPGGKTGATNGARLGLFALGLLFWALASWYSARVLLYFDFPEADRSQFERSKGWERFHGWLRCQVPRFLGFLPLGIVGWSFLRARRTYEAGAPVRLLYFGMLALLAGILLYVFFVLRRRWLDLRDDRTGQQDRQTLAQLERESRFAILLMAVISSLMTLLFIINPVFFAGNLGTGAVLMFAAASWVFWGSALVYLGGRYRLPLLTIIAMWVALCSLTNDNHGVRTVVREKEFQRDTVQGALIKWHARILQKYPDRPVHPLFIVAAEGGGIRAAYWTAAVLGSIQDVEPSFADHVFAISGVSGGSVGAVVFDALVADATPGSLAERAEAMLGRDFLSPAVAAMLYPDFVQRFWPWPYMFLDRGHWLEQSWEKAWRDTTTTNRLAEPFFDLWKRKDVYVPALFLNGTSVETGNRVIVSNLIIDGSFLDAEDATGKLLLALEHKRGRKPAVDFPLSTAAHLSARFTYLSPAGRFDTDGSHIVDGGYFENSGATTALDILREVSQAMSKSANGLGDIVPKIIMISNDPLGTGFSDRKITALREQLRNSTTTKEEAAHHRPGAFLEDALAPLYALLSAREARGVYAQRAIGKAQDVLYEKISAKQTATDETKVYFFSLAPAKVPLPLGWMLSNSAAEAMQQQLCDQGKSDKTKVQTWNNPMREQIVVSLSGRLPQPNPCLTPYPVSWAAP